MSTRTLSAICGFVAICITIWLESHGLKTQSQVFIWTVIALSGPVGAGKVVGEFRERWFWLGLATSTALHAFLVWRLSMQFPYRSTFAAIFLGTIEAVVLAIVSLNIRKLLDHDRAPQK